MKINFKTITIENFCGIQKFTTNLYNKTAITGKNGKGKSTIINAISWVFFNQLIDGSSPDGKIRPHNEDGKDIDYIDIKVSLTVDFNDEEFTLTKINKQKWSKSSTDQQKVMSGNVNEYLINNVPKIERDYKQFLEQYVSLEDLKYCLSPNTFLKLNTAKRREKIMSLFGKDVSLDDVIAKNSDFESIKADLKVGTVEELIAATKKSITRLKETQKAIPIRIDELSRQKESSDVTGLKEKEENIKSQIVQVQKEYEEHKSNRDKLNDLSKTYMDWKFKKSELEKTLYSSTEKALAEKRNLRISIDEINKSITNCKADIESRELFIQGNENEMKKLRARISQINTEKYAGDNKCPTCGQELPKEQIDSAIKKFEEDKKSEIAHLNDKGVSDKQQNEKLKNEIEELNKKVVKYEEALKVTEEDLSKIAVEEVDYTKNEDWVKLDNQIKDLEKTLSDSNMDELTEQIKECERKVTSLNADLLEVSNKIAVEESQNYDDRISELKTEAVEIEQKIAEEEKKKHILELFNKARIEALTEPVNNCFKIIKFRLFKPLIKDKNAFEDVCELLVNGTSYDSNLNVGFKILAEVDICEAFQKAFGVTAPIFIDNIESLDNERIPDTAGQLITIRRTDDDLTVKEIN